jgi:hypothetical protein
LIAKYIEGWSCGKGSAAVLAPLLASGAGLALNKYLVCRINIACHMEDNTE